jgi:hypothetical protein
MDKFSVDADRAMEIQKALAGWLMDNFAHDGAAEIAAALSYELGRLLAGCTREHPANADFMLRFFVVTMRQQIQAHHKRGIYE